MFYAGQYVVEGKANCLGGADMQVHSQFDLRAERMICQTVFAAERTNSSACTHSSLVCDREVLAILSKSAATVTSALAPNNVIGPIAIGDRQAACGSASKNLTTL
ncbi:unnamed protein product [Sphagnum troendelagicum]|uniref:Uncharacterized protein n=1 Tax=Sphagnum troendelagicum TaxID=128251 RepID=A0ABP0U7M1_9BRYO